MSFPTERYSQAVGGLAHNYIRNYTVALNFSGYPVDVALEEQLPSGTLDRYKVLVAAGVSNSYPETLPLLRSFVAKGGTLILGLEDLAQGEYGLPIDRGDFLNLKLGNALDAAPAPLVMQTHQAADLPGPLPAKPYREIQAGPDWTALASLGDKPVFLRKNYGDGHIYYIGARLNDYALASLLGPILEEKGLYPSASVLRADNGEMEVDFESHQVRSGNLTGFFLYNWDRYPKLVRFTSPEVVGSATSVVIDPLSSEGFPIAAGEVLLSVPASGKRVLVVGPRSEMEKRFGAVPLSDSTQVREEVARWTAAAESSRPAAAQQTTFSIDNNKAVLLDMKAVVNRGFADQVAGDGKGGWTDQGENSLHGEEWGRQTYCGVPFEIIRPDMNGGKAIVSLQSTHNPAGVSEVKGIEVGGKVQALYFLHSAAWAEPNAEVLSYVLHRPDGTTTVIPIRAGKEIGEWWINNAVNLHLTAAVGWHNSDNRGFFVYRWENPRPDQPVDSIDIVSSNQGAAGLVIAVTAVMK